MSEPILATAHKIVPQAQPRTCYVISLNLEKNKVTNFITIDKPDFVTNFVSVKGFFCDQLISEIAEKYQDIIKETPKEKVVEIIFPSEKINFIRSLIFKQK